MYLDPPAPQPRQPGQNRPSTATAKPGSPAKGLGVQSRVPSCLVTAWQTVLPLLESLTTALDKAYRLARSPRTWDAPVGTRYVEDMKRGGGRSRLRACTARPC